MKINMEINKKLLKNIGAIRHLYNVMTTTQEMGGCIYDIWEDAIDFGYKYPCGTESRTRVDIKVNNRIKKIIALFDQGKNWREELLRYMEQANYRLRGDIWESLRED